MGSSGRDDASLGRHMVGNALRVACPFGAVVLENYGDLPYNFNGVGVLLQGRRSVL